MRQAHDGTPTYDLWTCDLLPLGSLTAAGGGRNLAGMKHQADIAIIGPGKVGAALAILARRAGYRVAAMAGRDAQKTARVAAQIDPDIAVMTPAQAAAAGQIVLLTVPDDAIAPLCAELALAKAFRAETVVAHCSGALTSEALLPAVLQCKCFAASMHPLATFPTVEAALAGLRGAYCFIEGDAIAARSMTKFATDIGATPVAIAPEGKVLYHAAAVMACNYIVSLIDAALATGEKAGIDRGTFLAALAPILRSTVENVIALGPDAALTGPIARGDAGTVLRHSQALAGESGLDVIQLGMGLWTLMLAQRKGSIPPAAIMDTINAILAVKPKP